MLIVVLIVKVVMDHLVVNVYHVMIHNIDILIIINVYVKIIIMMMELI